MTCFLCLLSMEELLAWPIFEIGFIQYKEICIAFESVTTAIFVKLTLAERRLCLGSWGIWRSWCERYDASCQICKRKQYSLPGDLPGNANFCN